MIGAIPLIPLYACMCEFLLRYFKTTENSSLCSATIGVQEKKFTSITRITWLGLDRQQPASHCEGSGSIQGQSVLRDVVDEVARELGLFSEHFCFILLIGILSLPLHYRTCNLRNNQLPHYTLHFKRYCSNFFQ